MSRKKIFQSYTGGLNPTQLQHEFRVMAPDSPSPSPISIREASHDDLDSITNIFRAAFPFDPQYAYRFPYRKDHPEEEEKYTRMRISEYLDGAQTKAYKILMVETPSTDDSFLQEPIAYAIFSLPGLNGKGKLKLLTGLDVAIPVRMP